MFLGYTWYMKNILLTAFILGCFLVSEKVHAETKITTFLKIGIYSPEVKIMQQILNTDPITRVSSIGVGSPGFETNYFGALTYKAVVAFQSKNGLKADGLVGAMTREKLNAKLTTGGIPATTSSIIYPTGQNPNLVYPTTTPSNFTTPTITPISISAPASLFSTDIFSLSTTPIFISSISPINARPGDTVDILGSGFSNSMLAFLDVDNEVDFELINSGHIQIEVPDGEAEGSKWFYLANAHTDTRWTQPAFVLITTSLVNNSSDRFWEVLKTIERQNNKFLALADEKSNHWENTKKQIAKIFGEIIPIKPKTAHALVNNFFGGRITSTTTCTCPAYPGSIIYLTNLVVGGPMSIGYSPGSSTLHSNFNISVAGVQILGGTIPATFTCYQPSNTGCTSTDSANATIDSLRGVGTTAS